MSVVITEGSVTLEIDAEADSVVRWDRCSAYTAGVGRLQGTKAVDICADVLGHGAFYIEMKDYRGVRAKDIGRQVAEKLRDTLAGLVWACGRGIGHPGHERLAAALLKRRPQLVVWLETDRADPGGASALRGEIRRHLLPYLPPSKIVVTSTHLEKLSKAPLAWVRAGGVASPRLARRKRR